MAGSKHAIAPADVMELVDLAYKLAWVAAGSATTTSSATSKACTQQAGCDREQFAVEHGALESRAPSAYQQAANHTMSFDEQLGYVCDKLGGWEMVSLTTQMLYER